MNSFTRKYFDAAVAILGGVYIILLPLASHFYKHSIFVDLNTVTFAACSSVCLLTLITAGSILNRKNRVEIKITQIDILVAVYILYGVINLVFVKGCRFDPLWLVRWWGLISGYVLFRNVKEGKYILYAIVTAGIAQGVIAVLQVWGLFASNNIYFPATGSFRNPGPLGGYIAISTVFCLGLVADAVKQQKYIRAAVWFPALFILIVGLIIADSRAALVAVCGGGLCMAWQFFKPVSRNRRRTLIAAGIVLLAVLLITLIFYRPDSVKSRLLIWRVSADMIADKPVVGHGVGGFGDEYMLYQAKYFERNPNSDLAWFADTPISAFNEFIHIFAEQGIVGLVIVLSLLYFVLRQKHSNTNSSEWIRISALSALLIFSVFSYTAEVFPLFFYLVILIGLLRVQPYREFTIPPVVSLLGVIGVWVVAICSLDITDEYRKASDDILDLFSASPKSLKNETFSCLKYNHTFQDMYLQSLTLTKPMDETTHDRISEIASSYNSYLELGVISMRIGDYRAARECFATASHMIPNRILPVYMLWKISVEQEDLVEAISYARKIVSFEAKSTGTEVLMIKKEVATFLEPVIL